MKKTRKPEYAYAFAALAVLFLLTLPFSPALAAEPLVPCGNPGQPDCNICYFGELANRVTRFGIFDLAVPLAILMILYGGFRYAFSFGNPNNISAATKILKNTLVGLFLVFAAFFIVDTAIKVLVGGGDKFLKTFGPWNDPFKDKSFCEKFSVKSQYQSTAAEVPSVTTPSAVSRPAGVLGSSEARAKLAKVGIETNKSECPAGSTFQSVPGGCTSLGGIRASVIDSLIYLKRDCEAKMGVSSCSMTVTGGTEAGHATESPDGMTHASGYKVDISSKNVILNSYIVNNATREVKQRSDGAAVYQLKNGGTCAREGDHWDCGFR